jgi:hypothetical protein
MELLRIEFVRASSTRRPWFVMRGRFDAKDHQPAASFTETLSMLTSEAENQKGAQRYRTGSPEL